MYSYPLVSLKGHDKQQNPNPLYGVDSIYDIKTKDARDAANWENIMIVTNSPNNGKSKE